MRRIEFTGARELAASFEHHVLKKWAIPDSSAVFGAASATPEIQGDHRALSWSTLTTRTRC